MMAACLSCLHDTNGVNVPGQICDPADLACGPDWRKAGGNKVCFSGVGSYQLLKGRGTRTVALGQPKTALFRVDLEDRTEPPRGRKTARNERYRIRIWVLTDAELARLNDPNDGLVDFRQKISCSPESAAIMDGAAGALGSAVFGVRAPDIDDGGAVASGNNQVQPTTRNCP
jgi:hypothetical protein